LSAALIIDCSITMAWCFEDEATVAASIIQDRLDNETALVPSHWYLEVANVLAISERRNRISPTSSAEFLTWLASREIESDSEAQGRAFDHLLPLCRAHRLTAYDAVYLDLALRRRLPLASLDDDLRAAAESLGLEVLGR